MKPGNAYIEGSGGYFENFNFIFKAKEHKFRADITPINLSEEMKNNYGKKERGIHTAVRGLAQE
jgi:hypothetical protein